MAVGLAAIGFLSGCSHKADDSTVLARVGQRVISIDDFEKEAQWRVKNQRPLPGRQALLEEMIARETRLQKARAMGLENDSDVRREYETMLVTKLEERELTPRIEALKVSPDEVRASYETNAAHYARPAKVRLALIQVKTDPKLEADKLVELEGRINDARNQALSLPSLEHGFGRVAADFSEDQASRYKGGDVGWFDEGLTLYRWPKEVVSAGLALKTNGAVSEVIKTPAALYIVARMDSRSATATPLWQVEHSIERRLLADKQDQARKNFAQETRAFVPVQVFSQKLAGLEYPTTTVAKAAEPVPPAMPRSP